MRRVSRRLNLIILALLLLSFCSRPCLAINLNDLVKKEISLTPQSVIVEPSVSTFVSPLKNLDYRISFEDREQLYSGYDTYHILRFNFKGWHEISSTNKSERLAKQLRAAAKNDLENEKLFHRYSNLVKSIVTIQYQTLLQTRHAQLEKSVKKKSRMTGSKSSSLKNLMNSISEHQTSQGKIYGQTISANWNLSKDALQKVYLELIGNCSAIYSKTIDLNSNTNALTSQEIEHQLQVLGDEFSSERSSQFLTHFEVRKRENSDDNTYRIGFSLPLSFNDEEQQRKSALNSAKQMQMQAEKLQFDQQLSEQMALLKRLSSEINATQKKVEKFQALQGKFKKVRDMEVKQVLEQYGEESQMELLTLVEEFYKTYLGLLKDQLVFAQYPSKNLLSASWRDI